MALTLTRKEFNRAATTLCERLATCSKNNYDDASPFLLDWQVAPQTEIQGASLLHLIHPPVTRRRLDTSFIQGNHVADVDVHLEDETLVVDPDVTPPPTLSSSSSSNLLLLLEWQFSIVYSDTWQVPILFFTAQHMDGSPCLRYSLLKALGCQDGIDSYDFISYDEHPVTRVPSFFLHPCQTAARMKLLGATTEYFLVSWLSMVLPAIGFRMPPFVVSHAVKWPLRSRLLQPPTDY